MVRSEQLALLGIVVLPILHARAVSWTERFRLAAYSVLACVSVIAPWTIFNAMRYEQPFLLSTNGGSTLLAGNCPPATYSGDRTGYFDTTCEFRIAVENPRIDRSQFDRVAFATAVENIREHRDQMADVMKARVGRLLGVYNPEQTVALTAGWMMIDEKFVRWWVRSYWILLPSALVGALLALRSGAYVLPLIAPLSLSMVIAIATYGEPRYHSLSDLGVIVLAAYLLKRLSTGRAKRSRGMAV